MTSARCKKGTASRVNGVAACFCLSVLWGAVGCALDDFTLVVSEAGTDAGSPANDPPAFDAGPPDEGPACEPGVYRCAPTAPQLLQLCDPLTRTGWVTVERCDDAEACDAALGRCRVCTPGEHRCNSWRLQECNREGTDWVLLEECSAPERCDSEGVQCTTCLSGEAYCSGATLLSCNTNRDGYTATECASADECNVASMSCRACVPGELQCNLASLVRCSDALTWEPLADCASAALCEASLERHLDDPEAPVECVEPACEPGAFQCAEHDGRTLLGCPPDGSGFETIAVCASAAACDAAQGECVPPVCSPGSYQCSGSALQLCASDGSGWETLETCETPGACNTAARACVACEAGALQCSASELQRCTESASWEPLAVCASADLCDLESDAGRRGQCVEPACRPYEYRCSENQLELCNAARDGFTAVATCESQQACNASEGRCDVLGCAAAGAQRCRGQTLERCADDRSGWETLETCAPGSVCDLTLQGCAEQCPAQRFRCNGSVPEECVTESDGSIEWRASAAPCATEALCQATSSGASCTTPVCGGSLPSFRCDPSQPQRVQRCNAARTGWETERTCANGTTCDPGPSQQGPAQCDVCRPGSHACDGARLLRCESDGQKLTVLETCSDEAHCSASDSSGYCLRCDAGQTRCDADRLTVCSDDRRGWVESEACEPAFGCHTTADHHDYCNVCARPDEARCRDDTLDVCDAAQRVLTEQLDCELGCETVRNASDYCRECDPGTAQCSTTAATERQVCSATGLWETQTCPKGGDCYDAGTADYCGSCEPGALSCFSSTEQQECAMSGTPGAVRKCPSSTPVCLAASGQCVQCSPGSSPRCTGEVGSAGREVCTDSGSWRAEACTGSTPICHDGSCKACYPGSNRCAGTDARRRDTCNGNGTWKAANCDPKTVCWEGDCVACNPTTSAPRCTSSDGAGREVCVDGQWTAEACGDGLVCVGGDCLECDPASQASECLPSQGASARRVCEGGEWERADCADPAPQCQGKGQCVCQDGAARCAQSGMRQLCQGGVWVDSACVDAHCDGGECLECRDDADCDADLPACDEGVCVECTAEAASACDAGLCSDEHVCVECVADLDCELATPVCDEGACRGCTSDAECELRCLPDGSCGECLTAADCGGATPVCSDGECVACPGECRRCASDAGDGGEAPCPPGQSCVDGTCQ